MHQRPDDRDRGLLRVGRPGIVELRALDYFRRSAADPDRRMAEAVAVVASKRRPDGRWPLERIHPGRVHFDPEGGVGAPSRWNTLRALRVLAWWDGAA